MKWLIKHRKPIKHCDFWDELHGTCMFEQMESIARTKYRDERPAWENPAGCFDELD
jgi:hypothetical protein